MQGLSIVIPTYKEKNNLKNLIQRIVRSIKNISYEIIIIDDESNDGTFELLKELKSKNKNLKFFIRKKKPRDLSNSCIMGFQKAKNDSSPMSLPMSLKLKWVATVSMLASNNNCLVSPAPAGE